jgi:hypothetical protein
MRRRGDKRSAVLSSPPAATLLKGANDLPASLITSRGLISTPWRHYGILGRRLREIASRLEELKRRLPMAEFAAVKACNEDILANRGMRRKIVVGLSS